MSKRILMIHNFYQSYAPSGEDGVFREDEKLLRSKGHNISLFTRHSDSINEFSAFKKLSLAWQITWSSESYREIDYILNHEKPDIVHVCNTFPLISPSIFYACYKHKVPVVQTVQNYRLFCATGSFFRDNRVCEECMEYSRFRAIRYGCYRNSRFSSVPLVLMQGIHKLLNTWSKYVDIFIAATEFSRQKLIQGGLLANQVEVKPNFFLTSPEPNYEFGNYVLFLGRLSVEKGIRTLLSSWNQLNGIKLKIIGEGTLRNEVISATKNNSFIEFLGFRPNVECLEIMKHSMFMVMPSEWYEGFPMTIREAFACGKPVVASNMGAMAEIITDGKTGLLFRPGDADDFASKIELLAENKEYATEMGRNARLEFESKYGAEKNYEILMKIYEKAIEINSRKNVSE